MSLPPYHSTLVVRTSPDGRAEYRLDHPGSPLRPASASLRPALRSSRIGRRVRFAGQEAGEVWEGGDEEEEGRGEERFGAWAPPSHLSTPGQRLPAREQQLRTHEAGSPVVPQRAAAHAHAVAAPSPPGDYAGAAWTPQHCGGRGTPPSGVDHAQAPCTYTTSCGLGAFGGGHVQQNEEQQLPQPYFPAAGKPVRSPGYSGYGYDPSAAVHGAPAGLRPIPYPPPYPQRAPGREAPQPCSPLTQPGGQECQHQCQQGPAAAPENPAAASPPHALRRSCKLPQLQVTANSVSITVNAAALAGDGGSDRGCLQAQAAEPALLVAAPEQQHGGSQVTGQAHIGETARPSAEVASGAPALCATVSCHTQTEAPALQEASAGPPAALPAGGSLALPLPLPPGIPGPLGGRAAPDGSSELPVPGSGGLGRPAAQRPFENRHLEGALGLECSSEGERMSCWERSCRASSGSLSSGLSPREGQPRGRECDLLEALQALAAGAGTYARSARQHQVGRGGPVSAADALPARLAAQQLGSLAGMSRKVQEAILSSKRVFERQARAVEAAVLQRMFHAWKGLRDARALRQQRQEQLRRRCQRGLLRRCTRAWLRLAGLEEVLGAVMHKARAALARGLLQRCFQEWRWRAQDRRWKTQLAVKDRQIQLLANEVRHLESRPVGYMQRRRGRRWLQAWVDWAVLQRGKRESWATAAAHDKRQRAFKALVSWRELARLSTSRGRTLLRACRLLQRLRLRHCFLAWRRRVGSTTEKQCALAAAEGMRRQQLLQKAVGSWRYIAWFGRTARDAALASEHRTQAATLQAWRLLVGLLRSRRALLAAIDAARGSRLVASAYFGWRGYVDGKQARALQKERDRLAELSSRLQAEGGQLRQDNERLGRVIDSGDWGKERVAELVQAGEVLRRERDALLELVHSLEQQRQWPLQRLQTQQQQEKEEAQTEEGSSQRISAAGMQAGGMMPKRPLDQTLAPPRPLSPCNSPPASPGTRNKLLVKSGSSFNALVRALKQDLVTSGALARNPAATYQVDQLSLSRVGLKAGGELEVEALASPNLTGVAFGRSRPSSSGKRGEVSKQGDLLQAALRLQSIGGRSVATGKRL